MSGEVTYADMQKLHRLMHADFIHYLVALGEASRAWDVPLYLAGGAVRALVWDDIHDLPPSRPSDLDVAFFYRGQESEIAPRIEEWLRREFPWAPTWQVKNQASMHHYNDLPPFEDLGDAVSSWVETASAVAVQFPMYARDSLARGVPRIVAPHGLGDLFAGVVRTPPKLKHLAPKVRKRIENKGWLERWPKLRIEL